MFTRSMFTAAAFVLLNAACSSAPDAEGVADNGKQGCICEPK